jgi:thiamine biosynthesis lipoprotein
VAKGYAADAVADLLARAGIAHALVEVGGECVGPGCAPMAIRGGSIWRARRHRLPPLRVALHQLAVDLGRLPARRAHARSAPGMCRGAASAVSVLHLLHDGRRLGQCAGRGSHRGARDLAVREGLAARLIARDERWLRPALSAML